MADNFFINITGHSPVNASVQPVEKTMMKTLRDTKISKDIKLI